MSLPQQMMELQTEPYLIYGNIATTEQTFYLPVLQLKIIRSPISKLLIVGISVWHTQPFRVTRLFVVIFQMV